MPRNPLIQATLAAAATGMASVCTRVPAVAQAAGWRFTHCPGRVLTSCSSTSRAKSRFWIHCITAMSAPGTHWRQNRQQRFKHLCFFKEHPVTHMHRRQATALQAGTCRSPHAGWVMFLIRRGPLLQSGLHVRRIIEERMQLNGPRTPSFT